MNKEKHTIFVIDDEGELLEFYRDLLEEQYEVVAFQEPNAFIKYFDQDHFKMPHMVLTDLSLPSMTGIEMIERVQKKGWNFPFIILSGYLNKENVMKAVEVGVYRLLEKPVDPDILLSSIEQLIIEHDIVSVRKEIRELTSQLRELYTGIRIIMDQYIPKEVMDRMIIETTSSGQVKNKLSFDAVLENIESRLEKLLDSERILTEMKINNSRAEKV